MIQHTVDITIDRPVEEVFTFVTTPSNNPRWDVTSVEMHPESTGAWHAGMKLREVRKIGGRNTEVLSEIVQFEPDRRFTVRSLTRPGWLGQWRFEPAGTGTRLRFKAQMKMKGLMKLLEPVIGKSLKRDIDRNFERLNQALES